MKPTFQEKEFVHYCYLLNQISFNLIKEICDCP